MIDERERAEALATAYEDRLVGELADDRRARGAFYTPPDLVDWILDRALTTDSTAGARPGVRHRALPGRGGPSGRRARGARLGPRRRGGPDRPAAAAGRGPVGPGRGDRGPRAGGGRAHGLGRRRTFDAVVGNPPFLGQLKRRTAGQRGGLAAYTDTSAAFLHRALDLVVPGGTVALVQPLSVLGARDAGPVREAVAAAGAVTDLWVSDRPVFRGTSVLACVPVVRLGASGGPGPDEWGRLAAPYFGIPTSTWPPPARPLGDLAVVHGRLPRPVLRPGARTSATADAGTPLVTSGLIEPAACEWGRRPTRFARQRYDAPVVDVPPLAAGDPRLGAWADSRLVPKVLVAGQGRVIEAVVDERGEWLPSVPVLTVVPRDPADLWRVLAVLLAPPVVADAAARYVGTGLTPGSVKVSAKQLAALPLPAVDDDVAGRCRARPLGPARRRSPTGPALLAEAGAAMTAAYGGRAPGPRLVARPDRAWSLGLADRGQHPCQRCRHPSRLERGGEECGVLVLAAARRAPEAPEHRVRRPVAVERLVEQDVPGVEVARSGDHVEHARGIPSARTSSSSRSASQTNRATSRSCRGQGAIDVRRLPGVVQDRHRARPAQAGQCGEVPAEVGDAAHARRRRRP